MNDSGKDKTCQFSEFWPGIGEEVAAWVIEKKAAIVGSDAATDEFSAWIVHHELMLKNGIFNLEFMNF